MFEKTRQKIRSKKLDRKIKNKLEDIEARLLCDPDSVTKAEALMWKENADRKAEIEKKANDTKLRILSHKVCSKLPEGSQNMRWDREIDMKWFHHSFERWLFFDLKGYEMIARVEKKNFDSMSGYDSDRKNPTYRIVISNLTPLALNPKVADE